MYVSLYPKLIDKALHCTVTCCTLEPRYTARSLEPENWLVIAAFYSIVIAEQTWGHCTVLPTSNWFVLETTAELEPAMAEAAPTVVVIAEQSEDTAETSSPTPPTDCKAVLPEETTAELEPVMAVHCPTLAKGSKWHTIEIWVIDVFVFYLVCSSSRPNFRHQHSSC